MERVNRLDLHVDVTGRAFEDLGTRIAGSVAELEHATCRARKLVPYTELPRVTGYSFGDAGGAIYLRIYDKTTELAKGGHLRNLQVGQKTHYLLEIWQDAGWSGEQVLRIEFQLRREALTQFHPPAPEDDLILEEWDRYIHFVNAAWRYAC